jgi:FdhD protein
MNSEPLAFEAPPGWVPVPGAPRLTQARGSLLRAVTVRDERGRHRVLDIPAEWPLTVFVDRQELVTLMTLGACPELLVLGWLHNQGLVQRVDEIESITVDGAVQAAAVRTHQGLPDLAARTAQRVVTTGCGQGTVYGDLTARLETLRLPDAQTARIHQNTLLDLLAVMRLRPSVHRRAGSVHGCALFQGTRLLAACEDVGRHNAVDTLAGWMALHGVGGADKLLYTTGRLTSEMVTKAAQMGVPIVVSRNGVTAMGLDLAERLGMTLFGRAFNRHFVCYTGLERFDPAPLAGDPAGQCDTAA